MQTDGYARALFEAYRPNHPRAEVDQDVAIRTERALVFLTGRWHWVLWTPAGRGGAAAAGRRPQVTAAWLRRIADMAEAGRLRPHVLPFGAGAHSPGLDPVRHRRQGRRVPRLTHGDSPADPSRSSA
ncbi:Scr1 family TA system antitoxin-like transcriptional regulator [Streptomyces sp. NPDC006261]|uniref:Scr1 family TA system antitoxin-like transcriptional regulator n=1 Tax=Streptomyces sp. NPDC006261 TaxID=3156739 RepID=UPI0033AC36B9